MVWGFYPVLVIMITVLTEMQRIYSGILTLTHNSYGNILKRNWYAHKQTDFVTVNFVEQILTICKYYIWAIAEVSSYCEWTICISKRFESTLDEMGTLGQVKVHDTVLTVILFLSLLLSLKSISGRIFRNHHRLLNNLCFPTIIIGGKKPQTPKKPNCQNQIK